MKKITVSFFFLLLLAAAVQAQCGKNVTWAAAKTEYLDASGNVQRTENSPVSISTNTNHIIVNFKTSDGQTDKIEGDLGDLRCNWKEAFKNGRTSFKSVLAKSNGETKNAVITIEGIDGKLVITVELENMGGTKMRLPVESYQINS